MVSGTLAVGLLGAPVTAVAAPQPDEALPHGVVTSGPEFEDSPLDTDRVSTGSELLYAAQLPETRAADLVAQIRKKTTIVINRCVPTGSKSSPKNVCRQVAIAQNVTVIKDVVIPPHP